MSLDRWFGLSVYLTLGLSCVALVFAETFFLPGLQICLAPVLALLLLAWWFEGRWCLPTWGANVLGLVIAAGAAAVLATQWTDSDSWVSRVPWRARRAAVHRPVADGRAARQGVSACAVPAISGGCKGWG